ncbi:hypothetical protein [Shimia sp.]|uniref:hypothetical protein n=1 Tax=unclassified Shimia TaxID=2630038 RepID=UPI0025F69048|nr:hypothetical protein [Shimia sp.]MCH2066494.1 hypothetical protein [Shimia sp.]
MKIAAQQDDEGPHEAVVFEQDVLVKIDQLPLGKQQEISKGFASAYGRVLENLALMQVQTFWSEKQSHLLNLFSNHGTRVSVAGYAFNLRVCAETFSWKVWSMSVCDGRRTIPL